jgi:hypothetical protein
MSEIFSYLKTAENYGSRGFFSRVFEVKTSLEIPRENYFHRHASRHTLRGERLIRVRSREPSLIERARNSQLCVTSNFSLCFHCVATSLQK